MKKLVMAMVGLAWLSSHGMAENAMQTKDTVVLQPEMTYQSLEGWGSSLCWWAAQVGKWDEAKVDSIVDMLTSPDQLNMNIFCSRLRKRDRMPCLRLFPIRLPIG